MTGLAADHALFNHANVKSGRKLKVAAIVNWYGVADLVKASTTWYANYLNQVVPDAAARDSILKADSLEIMRRPLFNPNLFQKLPDRVVYHRHFSTVKISMFFPRNG